MGAELQFRKVKMFWKCIVDDGFTTVWMPFVEGKSTTNIVNKIQFKDGGENEENNEL